MKGLTLVTLLAVSLMRATTVAAQTTPTAPVTRGDVTGTVGWLNVNKSDITTYNDWYNRSLHGAASVGWYWRAHLKTEIEVSASTSATLYVSEEAVINGTRRFVPSTYWFSTRRVSLGQQYQFGENAWFHPYLAAGVDFNRERIRREEQPLFQFDPVTRTTRPVVQPGPPGDRTTLHVRPYAAAGFKAYMTRHVFFRTDGRLVAADRVEEVLIRFGFGVDF